MNAYTNPQRQEIRRSAIVYIQTMPVAQRLRSRNNVRKRFTVASKRTLRVVLTADGIMAAHLCTICRSVGANESGDAIEQPAQPETSPT